MARALLRGRASTTSRTMPRYTSSLTGLSRNGEIPMMNPEGGSRLAPWPAARDSGRKKLRAQRTARATGEQVFLCMRIRCRKLPGLIAVFAAGQGRRGRQAAARLGGIEVTAEVLAT